MITLPDISGELILGRADLTYKKVVDDFVNTTFIGIVTYNISQKEDGKLLRALKDACGTGIETILITNIPKRFPSYYGDSYASSAKKMIDSYLKLLDPKIFGANMSTSFLFENHAKIIVTDNMAYWGSSNFSDESAKNFECGTISTDKHVIQYFKNDLFPKLKELSIPYYKHNFVKALYLLNEAENLCLSTKEAFFEASFVPREDYDTNFETVWLYDTHHSGITKKLLNDFAHDFQQYEDALDILKDIVDEYCELDELPEDIERLKDISEEYSTVFEETQESIDELFDCINTLSTYNVEDEACRIITNKYGMESYDENLEHYTDIAIQEASDNYEEMIKEARPIIEQILKSLDEMASYINELNVTLHSLLKINSKINNTGL